MVAGSRKRPALVAVAASSALIAVGVLSWWTNPLAFPGAHRVAVYTLNEDLSRPAGRPPGFLSRLLGMCDADSYYVEQDGRPYCLVLNADTRAGEPRPLATVHVTMDNGSLVIGPADVDVLRDTATRVEQLTGAESVTLALVSREKPIAMLSVGALPDAGEVRVATFD